MPSYIAGIVGPCYTTEALCSEGISLEEQEQMVQDFRLLRLVSEDGVKAYPLWQFKKGTMSPAECLPALLPELAKGTSDSWAWAVWLIQPDQVPCWEKEPLDVLIEKARSDAQRWRSP